MLFDWSDGIINVTVTVWLKNLLNDLEDFFIEKRKEE
jgi:hypothetical protein